MDGVHGVRRVGRCEHGKSGSRIVAFVVVGDEVVEDGGAFAAGVGETVNLVGAGEIFEDGRAERKSQL